MRPETLYGLGDIAEVFGVGPSAVSNWRKRGSGPRLPEPMFQTTGGKPLYTRSQLEALIESQITRASNMLYGPK